MSVAQGEAFGDRYGETLVELDDRLAPFGPDAVSMVARVAHYATAGDVMVNSMYDVERDEVAAFEHQVGSHGGLGGAQSQAFVLFPSELRESPQPIEGPAALHRVLKGWLRELRQPVEISPRTSTAGTHRDSSGSTASG